jgi:hypothetical protein
MTSPLPKAGELRSGSVVEAAHRIEPLATSTARARRSPAETYKTPSTTAGLDTAGPPSASVHRVVGVVAIPGPGISPVLEGPPRYCGDQRDDAFVATTSALDCGEPAAAGGSDGTGVVGPHADTASTSANRPPVTQARERDVDRITNLVGVRGWCTPAVPQPDAGWAGFA